MTLPDPQDRFRTWDAAYLLGALSPEEQQEYEDHLAACPACQRAVAEIADLPDLLALAPGQSAAVIGSSPGVAAPGAGQTEVLEFGAARPARRGGRSRLVRLGAAAVLAVLVGVVGLAALRGVLPLGTPQPYRVAFEPVTPSAITAVLDVVPRGDGTTLKVECQYGSDTDRPYARSHGDYEIVVVDRSGESTVAKSWYARPDRQMRPTAETSLPVRRIEAVEIWDGDRHRPLLRATLR